MRIAINALYLHSPHTGTGQYITGLIPALAKLRPKDEFTVYVTKPADLPAPPNVTLRVLPLSKPWLGLGLATDYWEAHDVPRAVRESGADLYHATYATPRVRLNVPVIMTVHDMIPWQLPVYRRGLRRRGKRYRQLIGLKHADRLCTVSEASKQRITEITGFPEDRITVTYDGLSGAALGPAQAAAVDRVRKHYGLTRPYVLYIGGYDYRKNVRSLLAAFGRSGLARSHDLVLVAAASSPPTMLYDKLYADLRNLPKLIQAAGIGPQTQQLPVVDESEKHALLTGADCFVSPTLAEGFGLPILESLAVGTPVAASRIPSTVELFGQVVNLFKPEDIPEFAKVLRDTALKPRAGPRQRGRALAKRYTWEAVAKRTGAVYDEAMRRAPVKTRLDG